MADTQTLTSAEQQKIVDALREQSDAEHALGHVHVANETALLAQRVLLAHKVRLVMVRR